MKELTSSFDDLEKRMAIFAGLGAFLFTAFFLSLEGVDLITLLIRCSLALAAFTAAGWAWGHYTMRLLRKHADDEELPDNVVRESRDTAAVQGQVVNPSELAEAVIPAEEAGSRAQAFEMPDLSASPAPAAAMAGNDGQGDLPPPPVPPGL